MAKSSAHVDRAVRIELLRAKAALEREALVSSVVGAGRDLTPSALAKDVWPRLASMKGTTIAMQAYHLLRRYPIVGSSLSALALKGGGMLAGGGVMRLLKVAGLGFAGFKALRMVQEARSAPSARAQRDEATVQAARRTL